MSATRPRMCDLSPEELEALALSHVESMFAELHAACGAVREQCHPVKLMKRHPFAAAALAAAAAFLVGRSLRRKPAARPGEAGAAAAPGLFDSLLSGLAGAAGRALPALVASWLARPTKPE